MTNFYYRFLCGGMGIYAAVEQNCPRGDARRENKPDGAWLPKIGPQFPGAISFWTEFGLQTYINSNLLRWHLSVVEEPLEIVVSSLIDPLLYTDKYQVICQPNSVQQKNIYTLEAFFQYRGDLDHRLDF